MFGVRAGILLGKKCVEVLPPFARKLKLVPGHRMQVCQVYGLPILRLQVAEQTNEIRPLVTRLPSGRNWLSLWVRCLQDHPTPVVGCKWDDV